MDSILVISRNIIEEFRICILEKCTKVSHAVDLTMYQSPPTCVGNYVHLILQKYLQENQHYTRRYSYIKYVCKNANEQMFFRFFFCKNKYNFPSGTL